MEFVQTPLGTIEMVYMVPNGLYGAQLYLKNSIGHHRNGLYGAQWHFFRPHWAPYKPFLWCPMEFVQTPLGTIEMVYMVPNDVCLNPIGHRRNGLYGAQWYLNKFYWAP